VSDSGGVNEVTTRYLATPTGGDDGWAAKLAHPAGMIPNMRSVSRTRPGRGFVVAEAEFSLAYDGPGLTEHRIPVRDLAPSLLALGEVFVEANRLINPGGPEVALEITAADDGSWIAQLILTHVAPHSGPDLGDQIVSLLSGSEVQAIVNLRDLVIGSVGLFALGKWLRGRRIARRDPQPDGSVRIEAPDGTSISVPAALLTAHDSVRVRRSARQVVIPLNRPGIDALEFRSESEVTVSLDSGDVEAFEVEEGTPDDQIVVDNVYEAALIVETAQVAEPADKAWRFDDGTATFSAMVTDSKFNDDVLRNVERFGNGDLLIADVQRRQYRTEGGRLRNEWTILGVKDHRPGVTVTQPDLFSSPTPPPGRAVTDIEGDLP
jgi:hypothetical protein